MSSVSMCIHAVLTIQWVLTYKGNTFCLKYKTFILTKYGQFCIYLCINTIFGDIYLFIITIFGDIYLFIITIFGDIYLFIITIFGDAYLFINTIFGDIYLF